MIPSAHIPPLQSSSIHTMRETVRHSLLSLALSYRIMCVAWIQKTDLELTNAGPTAHLWSRYYHHFGIALRSLCREIQVEQNNIAPIFMSIHAIICSHVRMSSCALRTFLLKELMRWFARSPILTHRNGAFTPLAFWSSLNAAEVFVAY